MPIRSYRKEELPTNAVPQLAPRLGRCTFHLLHAATHTGERRSICITLLGAQFSFFIYTIVDQISEKFVLLTL